MKKFLLASIALAGVAVATMALNAFAAPGDALDGAQMQPMRESRAVMLEAHLAGMRAALELSPEQDKNWAPFEAAIRDAAKARAENWRQMREQMDRGGRPSPIEDMNAMSDHLQKMSVELKKVADASKPLYDSLSDGQKRSFGPLLREFAPQPPHEGGGMRHEGEGGSERNP